MPPNDWNGETDEAEIASVIDSCRGDAAGLDAVLGLLREDHPVHADRGSG